MNKIRTGETRGSGRHDRGGDHPGDRKRFVREASTDHAPWLLTQYRRLVRAG
jgi:hypothetical protein